MDAGHARVARERNGAARQDLAQARQVRILPLAQEREREVQLLVLRPGERGVPPARFIARSAEPAAVRASSGKGTLKKSRTILR
jgi:hypothetical protein